MKGAGWLPRPVTVVGRLRQRFHRGDFLLPFQTVRQTITGSAWKGPRMGTIYLWTILAYLLGLVVVGLKGSRGVASQEDFSVAGRRLITFVLFGTLLATWIGTGSIFGNAEKNLPRRGGCGNPSGSFAAGHCGFILPCRSEAVTTTRLAPETTRGCAGRCASWPCVIGAGATRR